MSSGSQHRPSSPPEGLPSPEKARGDFLLEQASVAGIAWSERIRASLRSEGRAACGGFPGTMREIRAHVATVVGSTLAASGQHALDATERDDSARVAYASARRDWLAHCVREDDDA